MPAALTVQVVESSADRVCAISGAALSGGASFDFGLDPHALSTKARPSSGLTELRAGGKEESGDACATSKRLLIEKAPYTQENSPREPDAATPGESF
jgi:hypothetical protein